MTVFEKGGKENTNAAAEIAVRTALEKDLPIVAATNTGATGYALLKAAEELGYKGNIILVTQCYHKNYKNAMDPEVRRDLEGKVYRLVTAAHALSAGERGISTVYKGMYPLEIIAQTLRLFGPGVKVCFESAVMAADNGAVEGGMPAVCVGGTHTGADTVCVITPSVSSSIFDTKVNEVVVKPSLYE